MNIKERITYCRGKTLNLFLSEIFKQKTSNYNTKVKKSTLRLNSADGRAYTV